MAGKVARGQGAQHRKWPLLGGPRSPPPQQQQQRQAQDKCADKMAFVYTGDNMALQEGERSVRRWLGGWRWEGVARECVCVGGGGGQTPASSLPSSAFFPPFSNGHCQNNRRQKRK